MSELLKIPLDKIRQNKVALRDVNREDDAFIQLTNSIKQYGVRNSISVRRRKSDIDDKEYELVDGLQRFSGAVEAGTGIVNEYVTGSNGQKVGVIPAQVVEEDDADVLITQIVANVHRIETKPIEYANQLIRVLGYNPTMTEAQLAAQLDKSPQWISNILRLKVLAESIQPLVNEGKICLVNAYNLSKLRDHEEQLAWVERAQTMDTGAFASQVTARVKEIRDENRKGNAANPEGFTPVAHMRKMAELKEAIHSNKGLVEIVRQTTELSGIPLTAEGLAQAALVGANLAIRWSLTIDPAAIEAQKAEHEKRKALEKADRERRAAEKKAKRDEEATKNTNQAKELAGV